MGKKIKLSGAGRFGNDFSGTEDSRIDQPLSAPKGHISALKRIGRANSNVPSTETEQSLPVDVNKNEENLATRFMVTVTNDRSSKIGTLANGTSSMNAHAQPVRQQSSLQSRLGNIALQNENQVMNSQAASSIEIIDLDAEPEAAAVAQVAQSPLKRYSGPGMAPKPPMRQSVPGIGGAKFGSNQQMHGNRQQSGGGQNYSNRNSMPGAVPRPQVMNRNEGMDQNRKRKHEQPMGVSREDQRIMASLATPSEEKAVLPGGRRKLFVAGFPKEGVKEADIKELFEKYGKVEEIWLNMEKCFGFLKLDSKVNAEKAKLELDRSSFKGRNLNVRLASQSSVIKVSNLGDFVTNELLRDAFEAFGELERVCVACSYNLKPLGYGFVEFSNKKRAELAIRKINENPFVLTKSVKPISVKPLEDNDEEDGISLKTIRPSQMMAMELSERPRFLEEGTFEYDVAMKWKMQYMFEERQREYLEQQLEESRARLELEVEDMYKNHKSWVLREELRRRQDELERLEKFKSSDSMLETKRAYLDRAAQAREEQFRMEEENFMKHQEQLRRNAEVHLVQQMAEPQSPDYDIPYVGGGSHGRTGGMGRSSMTPRYQEYDSPRSNNYIAQELMGGGAGGGSSLEYGAAASVMKARSIGMGGGGQTQLGGLGGGLGPSQMGGGGMRGAGLSSRLGGLGNSTLDQDRGASFDIQPIRRQQHY